MNDLPLLVGYSLENSKKINGSTLSVYKINSGNSFYILKGALHTDGFKIWQLRDEVVILNEMQGVKITNILHRYGDVFPYCEIILKEYFEGETLDKLNKKISDTKMQKEMMELVNEFHYHKIGEVELVPRNIVLSQDWSDFRLIDSGNCRFFRNCGEDFFDKIKSNDIKNLESNIFS